MSAPERGWAQIGLITGLLFVAGFAGTMLLNRFDTGFKELAGYAATGCSLAGLGYLLLETWLDHNQPHLFAWMAWTLVDIVAWYNSMTHSGGPGAWSLLAVTILTAMITGAAFRQCLAGVGDYRLTKADYVSLTGGIISVALVVVFQLGLFPALFSVIATTGTEVFAFGYTIKNIRRLPKAETRVNYAFNLVRQPVSILALTAYNAATLVYPVSLFFMNGATVAAIWWCRRRRPATE